MTTTPSPTSRRFVRAAWLLIALQFAAAAGAAGIAIWAATEVRQVIAERDALALRMRELEARGAAPAAAPAAEVPPAAPSLDPAAGAQESPAPDPAPNGDTPDPDPDLEPPPPSPRPPPPQQLTDCVLIDGTRSRCPLPWQRVSPGICLDVQRREASCPSGRPPPPPPPADDDVRDQPPPPPRDCRSVEGRPIVCAPPYRGTPVRGICVDRNNRPMRCPPGQPPREPRPTTTGATPTRPTPTTRTPTQPSATTRPSPSTSSTAPPRTTRPTTTRQPTSNVPATRQPATTTAPQRTTRPVTTAPTTVRPAPVRRPLPPPESNQAQPR